MRPGLNVRDSAYLTEDTGAGQFGFNEARTERPG